ncbi:MAG: hypothetical protein JNJ59_17115 [Deltaproteobacteria bacterium]|nr:hypothetical protein [Deltaproteobacteria bacterium]
MTSGDRLEVLRHGTVVPAQPLEVGPFRLSVSASPPWDEALALLLSGFARAEVPADLGQRLRFELALTTATRTHHGLPRSARFALEDDTWVDASEGWDAQVRLGDRTAPGLRAGQAEPLVATFALRDEPPIGASPRWAIRRELVTSALRAALSLAAPHAGGLLLHASAMVDPEGRGVVFLGPSGEGKTTLTRRLPWQVLSDDAALVWRDATGSGWHVAGTPLRGKEGLARSARTAPLTHIVTLQKGRPLALTLASPSSAMAAILARTIYYAAPDARVLGVMQALAEEVRASTLGSRLDDDLLALAPRLAGGEA